MKTYILKFKDKDEALQVLIPLGFGYLSLSQGATLVENVMGEFFLEELPPLNNAYKVKIVLIKETQEIIDELDKYEDKV